MAIHSSVLAWRISGTEEPGGLPSMRLHRVGHDWSDLAAAAAALTQILLLTGVLNITAFLFIMSILVQPVTSMSLSVLCIRHLPNLTLLCHDLVQFSLSVVSDSWRPHGLQHARLSCPSPTPRACSNSCHWVCDCHVYAKVFQWQWWIKRSRYRNLTVILKHYIYHW